MSNNKTPIKNTEGVGDKLIEKLLFDFLKEKYNLSKDDITSLSKNKDSNSGSIPVSILSNSKLSSLECIVKFLRENRNLSYINIALLLNRNPKTLAVTYNIASKKIQTKFNDSLDNDNNRVPFSAFNNNLSVLEAICVHLKSVGHSYSDIAKLLGKDQRTIWTVCKRAENKSRNSSKVDVRTNSENNSRVRSENNTKNNTKSNNDRPR